MPDQDAAVWTGIIGVLGPIVTLIVTTWWQDRREDRRERRTVERAREIVASPEGTSDPREAVELATLEMQVGKVVDQARKVRESFNPPMNGHRLGPEIEITEDKD